MSRLSTTDRCTGRDADLATVQIALAASSTPEAITCRLLALGGANCLLPVHRAIESHVHTSSSHVYAVDESNDATSAWGYEDPEQTRFGALECTRSTGAFYLTLVPIRPRRRGERRSLRTLSRRVSPPTPRFQSRHTSTPFNSASDAFRTPPRRSLVRNDPHSADARRPRARPRVALADVVSRRRRERARARARGATEDELGAQGAHPEPPRERTGARPIENRFRFRFRFSDFFARRADRPTSLLSTFVSFRFV